jgi:hypothetical protein
MDNTKLLNAVCILVSHAFRHKRITGVFPDHRYLIVAFEIPYDLADHVLSVATMVDARQAQS